MPQTVTITASKANTTKAIEYSRNGGTTWQSSNVFTGVPAGQIAGSQFRARLVGTAISDAWETAVVVEADVPGAVELVFISGQSNGEGKGEIFRLNEAPLNTVQPPVTDPFERVRIYNPFTEELEALHVGVNELGAVADNQVTYNTFFGREIGFAQAWEAEHPTGELVIVKSALSAQALSYWDKAAGGSSGYAQLVNRYTSAKALLLAEGKTPVSKGFLWYQGEADSTVPALVSVYAQKLSEMFANYQADGVITAQTRLVIGQVRLSPTLQAQQQTFVNAHPTARLVVTDQYNCPDNLHYDANVNLCDGMSHSYNAVYDTTRPFLFPVEGKLRVLQPGEQRTDANGAGSKWYFSAGWNFSQDATSPASTGGYAFTAVNAFAGTSFVGTSLAIDLPRFAGLSAKVDLYIDEQFHSTVTLVGGANEPVAQRAAITGLSGGTHTLKVVARASYQTQGFYGIIDRVRVQGTFVAYVGGTSMPGETGPPAIVAYQQDDANVYKQGNWQTVDLGANGSIITLTTTETGFVGFTFDGTGFFLDLPALSGGNAMAIDIWVDDEKKLALSVPGNGQGTASTTEERYALTGLPNQHHTVKCVFYGQSTFAGFDRVRVEGTLVTYEGGPNDPRFGKQNELLIDDADTSSIVYVGDWYLNTNQAGHYARTFTFSANEGNTATYTHPGCTGFSLDTVGVGFQTKYDVKIDGVLQATPDYSADTPNPQLSERFSIDGLPYGAHTIQIVDRFSTYGARPIIDKIRVRGVQA